MMIHLLDDSLQVKIFYDTSDRAYADNICVRIKENCPAEERLLRGQETNIFITPQQACQLAQALSKAAKCSMRD
jgi:hypothetical protein